MPTLPDLELLRRFEPIVRYTKGERFFPIDAKEYIEQCSLWVRLPSGEHVELVPQGKLSEEILIEPRQHGFGAVYYLKFIEPLDLIELAKYSLDQAVQKLTQRSTEEIFRAGRGRLARVGYSSRVVDALFSLTLFWRGRVPGDTSAAAALTYRRILQAGEQYTYYGRVVRENSWVILQYWYFYPFNNWRSGFFGVNDHEGDWEMVTIYCAYDGKQDDERKADLTPAWVAYASHDFAGDDLRRRWDDPEVEKVQDGRGGCHPVVYAGAGSHASYFSSGEYLAELELPFLLPLARLLQRAQKAWSETFRLTEVHNQAADLTIFRVPFVDYARGDGLSIGAESHKVWTCVLLDDNLPWVDGYRGLWGLYASDPISGENAPAGPMYNRDGSVRRSWCDPLGWSGLDKLPTPHEALMVLAEQRNRRIELCAEIREQIDRKSVELKGLGLELTALEGKAHLERAFVESSRQIAALSQELGRLRSRLSVEEARLDALNLQGQRMKQGVYGSMRGHIHRQSRPSNQEDNLRLGGFAEWFAAVSIGLVMIGIVLLILFARDYLVFGLSILIGLLFFVEAGFRRRLSQLISSLVFGLAVISTIILIFEFFWQWVVLAVLSAGLFVMWENWREIRS